MNYKLEYLLKANFPFASRKSHKMRAGTILYDKYNQPLQQKYSHSFFHVRTRDLFHPKLLLSNTVCSQCVYGTSETLSPTIPGQ